MAKIFAVPEWPLFFKYNGLGRKSWYPINSSAGKGRGIALNDDMDTGDCSSPPHNLKFCIHVC